jgi:hypothetical protein
LSRNDFVAIRGAICHVPQGILVVLSAEERSYADPQTPLSR